ncbi:hypothetical protein SAMN05216267_1002256 [Actinacidiphila rubida]|uniref:Golvesin/Xly CBD-like domain-containing protein n=1 Tax=Actinacidiphila rubida TaxID=310780 RepID=A0A1H8EK64_9ACTN|nr:hypothetical protein [Actinacidiphila rubida]SEN19961.1 hypothetical protein SAMN05216267_1002256 [Actinacidiphila rubida]
MHRTRARHLLATSAAAATTAVLLSLAGPPALAAPPAAQPTSSTPATATTPTAQARALGPGWHDSRDLILDTAEDSAGYHLFTAAGRSGFAWQPLATLKPLDLDSSSWTGYSCLTGDGKHVVAVVAPGGFANVPALRDRGAFAYVVDVPDGTVHPVTSGVALTYSSPGCGAGDDAVLTRSLGEDEQSTQLVTVHAGTATVSAPVTEPGQLTSAVPAGEGRILAARGAALVQVGERGTVRTLATAPGQVFDVVADQAGNATFLARHGTGADVLRAAGGRVTPLARGELTSTGLFNGRGGHPVLVARSLTGSVPKGVATTVTRSLPDVVDAVSLDGQAVAGHAATGRPAAGGTAATPSPAAGSGRIAVRLVATATGRALAGSADLGRAAPATTAVSRTGFATGATAPSRLGTASGRSATTSGRSPAASGRSATTSGRLAAVAQTPACAVPRNDPTLQAMQPGAPQVQRAVDLAVTGQLTDQRPANFMNMGLAAYQPSGDFPPHALTGGGTVPAQVFLGLLAQESNFDQASWHSLPGLSGNPLIADYYGSAGTVDVINYAAADCGYGISQVTTGMGAYDPTYSQHGKMKIAVDYEENIAAGLQILEDKWNQLAAAGTIANNGDSSKIENWYLALWAYNTGFHAADSAGNTGLGWTNNPINPAYPPNRDLFLRNGYGDAAHPANWPYQERVLGWVEHPILNYKSQTSYLTPHYSGAIRGLIVPSAALFCDGSDNCDAADPTQTFCGYGNLTKDDPLYYHCWWHQPVTWAPDCATACATQSLAFTPGSADPGVTDPHPADCQSTLPAGSVLVDELATPAQNTAGCTGMNWTNGGSFQLSYGTNAAGDPIAAIDTHQLGAGFGGHLYFTHNRAAGDTQHQVTGTWTAALPTNLYHVLAHTPSTGGTTDSAHYKVTAADGTVYDRPISQHTSADEWQNVGYFQLGSNAQVTLNNVTDDSSLGTHDVAFDAVAFVPVSGTFQHHSFDAVSLFDPQQNITTNSPTAVQSPLNTMQMLYAWGLDRTVGGPDWANPQQQDVGLGGMNFPSCDTGPKTADCVGQATLAAVQKWGTEVQEAGDTATGTGSADGMTPARLMQFSVPRPDLTKTPDQNYAADTSYKIKTHVDVTYAVDSQGNVFNGSQSAAVTSRTGTTELPDWLTGFVAGVQADYGIPIPDLSYDEVNANAYTGDPTHVPNPLVTGTTPGEAYMPHVSGPQVDSTGKCVAVKAISGGSIGYRPLDTQSGKTDANFSAWVAQIQSAVNAGQMPPQMATTATDFSNMFFRGWGDTEGSLFNGAPPIWQQVTTAFCSDGTVESTQTVPNGDDSPQNSLVAQSYMPSLYLYLDGKLVDQSGHPTTGPVQTGDFVNFSNVPGANSDAGNAYDNCNIVQRGNGGNPWNIGPPAPGVSQNANPRHLIYCDDLSWYDDTYAP